MQKSLILSSIGMGDLLKARPEIPVPAPPAGERPEPRRLPPPPALEYFGLRTVVAFGRTVGRGQRPGIDEAVKHLPEG